MTEKTGFTLLEIMIVLVIVGIMSTVLVLNIGASTYTTFMSDAKKIAATLSIISDEAVYTNSVISCKIDTNGFNCRSYKNEQWSALNINKLVSWSWPKNFTVQQVLINGVPIKENETIKFFANGDQQPTSIQVSNGKYTTWVDGDMNGIFQVNN